MNKYILSVFLSAIALPAFSQITDELAEDAYVYGYSMDQAYKFFYKTTVNKGIPLNRFQNIRHIADDSYTEHPTINNDTLHLQGWLDISAEPVIISVPDMDKGRYWILHTMDMGHYTTSMIGSRMRGNQGGRFMFASPNWSGDVPASVTEVIRVDSNLIKVMGRIMATNKEDEKIALNYMDEWNIRTLSAYLGESGPSEKQRTYPDPSKTNWLQRVNFVLCDGNIGAVDNKWLVQYKEIGIEPCKNEFSPEQIAAATKGETLGLARLKMIAPTVTSSTKSLGTRQELQDGQRDLFAIGTLLGQWGLPAEESVYFQAVKGSDGKSINGAGGKKYSIKMKAPDVSQFWSLTVYGMDNKLMVHNDINRHSRGDRTLQPSSDGVYTIELATKGDAKNTNWLPIPEKDVYVVLRLYGPSEDIQAGKYSMPMLQVVEK